MGRKIRGRIRAKEGKWGGQNKGKIEGKKIRAG